MKRILIALLAVSMVLCGCQTNSAPAQTTTAPTQPTTDITTAPTTEVTTAPTTEPATVPTEPPVLYRSPLTGEPISEPMTTRPVAVVINNIRAAQPLHGIGQADVLFEIVAEGGGSITRCLAIYSDLGSVEKVGSIRSARTYLIDLARAFRAPLIHCGASEYAYEDMKNNSYAHIDEMYNSAYFYRDKDRQNAGYSSEHTLFANGEKLMQAIEKKNYNMVNEGGTDFGLTFSDYVNLYGAPASQIAFTFNRYDSGKYTYMTYDPETGAYYGSQRWRNSKGELGNPRDLADANTGEKVPYRNVLILYAKTTTDGYRMFAELTGEGTGYFACGGQIVPIKWSRSSLSNPFAFTLEDGTPVTLGVGKSYIGVLSRNCPVEYE